MAGTGPQRRATAAVHDVEGGVRIRECRIGLTAGAFCGWPRLRRTPLWVRRRSAAVTWPSPSRAPVGGSGAAETRAGFRRLSAHGEQPRGLPGVRPPPRDRCAYATALSWDRGRPLCSARAARCDAMAHRQTVSSGCARSGATDEIPRWARRGLVRCRATVTVHSLDWDGLAIGAGRVLRAGSTLRVGFTFRREGRGDSAPYRKTDLLHGNSARRAGQRSDDPTAADRRFLV
jgi:hypothetical protein